MYRATSPYMPEGTQYGGPHSRPGTTAPYPTSPMMAPSSPYNQPPGNVAPTAPGSIMYTTTAGPNGQPIYHPYTAVPASYNTDAGTVTGIQWISAGPTHQLPQNAAPATASFAEQMQRSGQMSGADQKALKDWQKAEEKRRRKEEKEASRQLRDKDRYGRTEDPDIRLARERDAAVTRERRKSFSAGAAPNTMAFPGGAPGSAYGGGGGQPQFPGGYPSETPSAYGHGRDRSVGGLGDLDSQFGGLEIERGSEYGGDRQERQRKMSGYGARSRPTSAYGAPTENFAEQRERRMSGNFGASGAVPPRPYSAAGVRAGGAGFSDSNANAYSPRGNAYSRPASPNSQAVQPGPYGVNLSTSPNPHLSAGYGNATSHGAYSRPASPNPRPVVMGGYPGHGMDQGQMGQQFPGAAPAPLAAPEGFARPPSAALPYTYFETQKVCDMEEGLQYMPKLPPMLNTHDVYNEDWSRLMGDISRAWAGKLNVPTDNGRPPRRSTLAGQILDIWNDNFFGRRGIELVLYKGRERRSGPRDGVVDLPEYLFESELSSDSSSSETGTDDSDLDDPRGGGGAAYGTVYGGGYAPSEAAEARRHRREAKVEKKRRRKEKRVRRKAKAREKKYALYMLCTSPGGPATTGGFPGAVPQGQYAGYGQGAPQVPGYGPPPTQGYGHQAPAYGSTTPSVGYGPTTPSVAGGYGGLPHY